MSNLDLRPRLSGSSTPASWRQRPVLLICFYDPNGITTVWENIRLWQQFSRFEFRVLNLWPGSGSTLALPAGLDLDDFLGVVIHPTVAYSPDNLQGLDRLLRRGFRSYDGVKVLAKQDEQYRSAAWPGFVRDAGIDLLLTCVPAGEQEKVYPRQVIGADVEIMQTLTGYVTPFMRALASPRLDGRRLDIFYRGSRQPLSFGRLGLEKWKIGADVSAHPAAAALRADISSRWEDRIHGKHWYDVLAASRIVLGVESGSNLFDFDGEVERLCSEFAARNRDMEQWSEAYFLKAESEFLQRFEGNVRYAQISPRHLEAAAAGAVQLLYEGTYSDIFVPHRHYLPLRRDLSNLEEALETAFSAEGQRLADAAREEVIEHPRHHQESFVAAFDERFAALARLRRPGRTVFALPGWRADLPSALVLSARDPDFAPQAGRIAASLEGAGCRVCELGLLDPARSGPSPAAVTPRTEHRVRVGVGRNAHADPVLLPIGDRGVMGRPGWAEIATLAACAASGPEGLTRAVGAHGAEDSELARFRSSCRDQADAASSLLQAGLAMGPFDLVVATDTESLAAAVALRSSWGSIPLAFYAWQAWPDLEADAPSWECAFRSELEGALLREADRHAAGSPQLALHLSAEYGLPFAFVADAATRDEATEAATAPRTGGRDLRFLYQGDFTEVFALRCLVDAWFDVRGGARLILSGPDSPRRQALEAQADLLGMRGTRVEFVPAAPADAQVRLAAEADICVVLHDTGPAVRRFAYPAGLAAALAAGRPMLTNAVEQLPELAVPGGNCWPVALGDKAAFVSVVNRCIEDRASLPAMGLAAREAFERLRPWEAAADPFFDSLVSGLRGKGLDPARPQPDIAAVLATTPAGKPRAAGAAKAPPARPEDAWPAWKRLFWAGLGAVSPKSRYWVARGVSRWRARRR